MQEASMRSVMYRLNSADFADQMVKMRRWLDHRECTVRDFKCYRIAGEIIVI